MSLLRRALAGASATVLLTGALVAGGTAPAAAETSSFCPHAGSTRLFTANGGQYKVWLYQTANPYNGSLEYHLCYAASPDVAGDLVIRTGVTGSLVPYVDYNTSDQNCPDFFTVQDPIQFVSQLGTSYWPYYSFCFGAGEGTDTSAVRVTFGLPTIWAAPSVELWVDRYTTVATAYCKAVNDYQCRYPQYYPAIRVV